MTSPINMTFTPGTTITTDWCNGVNDAINNSTQDIAGSVPRTVPDKLSDTISVKDFGAVGDGITDDTAAIQNARDFIAGNATRYGLVFPSGIYKYSVSPNWAIDNLDVVANGEVKLRYTGTGNAVIFDGGSTDVFNVTFGLTNNFIVEAPSTALNGVYTNKVNHSFFGFNVRGCGTSSSGLKVASAVCNTYKIVVSANEEGGSWYLSAKPAFGINLGTGTTFATQCCYCLFNEPIIEGTDIGIQLTNTLGNSFVSGTSEGCSSYGLVTSAYSFNDKFIGVDFEVNTIVDIYALGNYLTLTSCETNNEVNFGSTAFGCIVDGGTHKSIVLDTGSICCSVVNAQYNRSNNGGTLTDAGTNSYISNVIDAPTNSRWGVGTVAFAPGTIAAGTTDTAVVTIAGAKLGDPVIASMSTNAAGLAVSAIVTGANTATVYFTNITGSPVTLSSGTVKAAILRI